MKILKKLLGILPTPTQDGAFSPSPLALKLATSNKTDFEDIKYENQYKGNKKILMLCTNEKNMTMENGTKFSTGNHPVEMLVPMLHLKNAGFDVDIYTLDGKEVQLELWAMPNEDENVKKLYEEKKQDFQNPKNLKDFVQNDMRNSEDYLAIFIPGGHGAMLGLPQSLEVKDLLFWAKQKDLFTLAICHAPAVLLAGNLENKENDFIYKDYKMAVFPDSVDEQSPMIGYMPGHLTWKFGQELEKLGVSFVNKKADKTCFKDRNLITGASPKAANEFGKLCAKSLLEKINKG